MRFRYKAWVRKVKGYEQGTLEFLIEVVNQCTYSSLGPHISFKYTRYNHLRCSMMGEVSLETYPN